MAQINIPNAGFWSAIASALNSMFAELFGRTGWASYSDTQYTAGSPFAVSADVDTLLPNNAGTVIDSQKPNYIDTYYASGEILGRNGDGLALMIYFRAIPTSVSQYLELWIDITGGAGTPSNLANLYRDTFTFPKGIGVDQGILFPFPAGYTLDTWEANSGKVYIRTNAALTIYGINYNFTTTHKAK